MEPQNPTPIQSEPTQPVQPTTPEPTFSQPSSRPKWMMILLGVIVIALVGAIGFYLGDHKAAISWQLELRLHPLPTPKPGCYYQEVVCIKAPCPPILMCPTTTPVQTIDQTKDWKTYTNESLGFSLKYPTDWDLDTTHAEKYIHITSKEKSSLPESLPKMIVISLYRNPDNLDFKKLINKSLGRDLDQNLNYKLDNFKGYAIYKLTDFLSVQGNTEVFFQKSNHDFIMVDFEGYSDTNHEAERENRELFYNMLSTFKFTDQNQMDTLNWKTYTETQEVGFSVQYSPTWLITLNPEDKHRVVLEGAEGKINIGWGFQGVGGGCPENQESIQLKNGTRNVCHYPAEVSTNRLEEYTFFFKAKNSAGSLTASISSANNPQLVISNRAKVLQILSTLNFTN